MPSKTRPRLVIPILIIIVGVGWLLTAKGFAPGINWIWTLALGTIGILTFVVSTGVDKVSIVIGPFFLLASILSILRQTGRLSLEVEVPILVIAIGVLLLIAQLPFVGRPAWFSSPWPAAGPSPPPGSTASKSATSVSSQSQIQ